MNFHGDTIDAVKDGDKVWVSLRRCCENLGLSVEPQLAKLKGKPWACMTEIVMQVPGSTQSRAYTMVDLDTLPGWLFSIDARKVKEQVREKLARRQPRARCPRLPQTGNHGLLLRGCRRPRGGPAGGRRVDGGHRGCRSRGALG